MLTYAPRLPFSLDPLMKEAKRRARQRRLLLALVAVLIAGGALGTAFAMRLSNGGGPTVASHQTSKPAPWVAADCGSGAPGQGFHVFACMSGGARAGHPHPEELLVIRNEGSSVAAIQLIAILLLLYTALAAPSNPRTTAAAAFCLTLVARLLLANDIYKLTGRRLISTITLWIIAAGFALVAVLLGLAAAESGGGARASVAALVSGSFCLTMIYMIRRRRA